MLGGVAIGSGLPLDDGAEFDGGLWMGESVNRASEREKKRRRSQRGQGGRGEPPRKRREEGSALTLSPPGATESGAGPVRGVLATVADRRRAILSCVCVLV